MFSQGAVAEKDPSPAQQCVPLPLSAPIQSPGAGRRRGAAPGHGLPALPVQSLPKVGTGRLYSYLHATLT